MPKFFPVFSTVLLLVFFLNAEAQDSTKQPQDLPVAAAQILWKNCFSCHNGLTKKGSLNLQSHEALLHGGAHGSALVPGRSDESRMILMMEGVIEPQMPQGGFLLDEDIKVIRDWIDAGAKPWPATLAPPQPALPKIELRAAVQPPIASLAFRADGKLLAVGSYVEVRLVDPQDPGKVKAHLPGHADTVRALAFSPDGSLLAAAGGAPARYGEIKIWEVEDAKLRKTLQGHNDCIYSAVFSPDGKQLATASYDRLIKLWDLESGKEVRTLKDHIDAVFAVAFSPDGKRLASASADRTIKIWDVSSGERLFTLSEAADALYAVTFHPTGRFLAAAGVDKRVRLWKLGAQGGELVRSCFAHESAILHLTFTPDGNTLISAAVDRLVKLWDVETLQEKKVLGPQSDWVLALAVSPNGKLLATGCYDGSLGLYEVGGNAK